MARTALPKSIKPMLRPIKPLKTNKQSPMETTLPLRPLRKLDSVAKPPTPSASSGSTTASAPTPPPDSSLISNPSAHLSYSSSWAWTELEEQDCLHLFFGGESVSSTPYQLFRLGHNHHPYPFLRSEADIRSKLQGIQSLDDDKFSILLAGIGIVNRTEDNIIKIKKEMNTRRENEIVFSGPVDVAATPAPSAGMASSSRKSTAIPEAQVKGKRKAASITSSDEEDTGVKTPKRKCRSNPFNTPIGADFTHANASASLGKKPAMPIRPLKRASKSPNQKILLPKLTPTALAPIAQAPTLVINTAQVKFGKDDPSVNWPCGENVVPADQKVDIRAFDQDVTAFIASCDWQQQQSQLSEPGFGQCLGLFSPSPYSGELVC